MHESQTLPRLRRNDPDEKFVSVRLWEEQDDVVLAEALVRNDYVNDIRFIIDMRQTEQQQQQHHCWNNLLRVLATREKLEKVEFDGSFGDRSPITGEHAMILQAVQHNASVRSVRFFCCGLASGEIISSFLDTATSLMQFDLHACSMTTQGAGRIAASLQRNTNLRTLSLGGSNLEDSHLTRILQGLEVNTCLQSLVLNDQTLGQAVSLVIQHLLERTPSIQVLELHHLSFTEERLRPICQGLIRSTTVSKVRFDRCSFTDLASMDLFRQLLETKPNLQLLSIHYCSFPGNTRALLGATMSAVLLQPNSPLPNLELQLFNLDTLFPGPTFGALLRAVGRSGLERFSIGEICSDEQFHTLLSSLPAMKIQELEFGLTYQVRQEANRQDVLHGVKQNFSLRSLKVRFDSTFFSDDEKALLEFYFDRNERLAEWVANPDTIPRLLWPDTLGLALEAGEDSLYRSLQAVLGDEVESALGRRKRQADKDKKL